MRLSLLTFICIAFIFKSTAQPFLGMSGTENTITLIKDNPVFAVHEDRVQYNILGLGFEAGGNSLYFKKRAFNYLLSGKAAMDKDYFRNDNTGKDKTFWGNFEVQGPGAAFLVRRKYFVAITTGMRYMVNSDHLNTDVATLLGVNAPKDTALVGHNMENYNITSNAFSELDFTYGGYFMEGEEHSFEGGLTVKLLSGAGAAGMGISQASFTTKGNDGYAYNVKGLANVAFTPFANEWAISSNPFNAFRHPMNNLGAGFSAGFAYYYNPRVSMQVMRGYKLRVAMSVTDVGSISYEASTMSGSYRISDSALNYRDIKNEPRTTFGNHILNNYILTGKASPTNGSRRFKVGLPTALHINADYKFTNSIFLNTNALINLRKPTSDEYATHYISSLTITPKYKYYGYSFSAPLSINVLMQAYMGAMVEKGAFYLGSTSLLQYAVANKLNNINIFFGSTVRIRGRKQKNADEMML